MIVVNRFSKNKNTFCLLPTFLSQGVSRKNCSVQIVLFGKNKNNGWVIHYFSLLYFNLLWDPSPPPGQFRSLLPPPLPLWTVYNLFSFLILFLFLSLLFFFPSEFSHGLTGPYSCPYQNGFRWKSNHFTCGEYAHFLVACHATLHPALSVRLSVRPFIRHALLFVFFAVFFRSQCSCPNDLNYGPCPPARDWDSRVSGLL